MIEGREFLLGDDPEDCQDGRGSMSNSPVARQTMACVPTWKATVLGVPHTQGSERDRQRESLIIYRTSKESETVIRKAKLAPLQFRWVVCNPGCTLKLLENFYKIQIPEHQVWQSWLNLSPVESWLI